MTLTLMESLRIIRLRLHLSQDEMAEKLGVQPRTLKAWEQGRRNPVSYFVPVLEKFVKENSK